MSLMPYEERFAELPNGQRLCYAEHGDAQAPALLLVVGLGLQLSYWPAALIEPLLAAGLRVIRFDNRDAGRSSRCATPHPNLWQQLRGRAPQGAYGLEQMADDTALLLDHLGIAQAHLLGMSMGGMIAQVLAYRHPQRVASLVSIFSNTGARRIGQPAYSTLWRMARAKAPRSEAEAVSSYAAMMRHIGDREAPDIEAQWAEYAALAWRRNGERADSRALFRQIGAILKSADRGAALASVRAPSLVLHGDRDLMVHPSGGEATARAIPGARHATLAGLRHQIDVQQSPRIAQHVLQHIHAQGEVAR